MPHVLSVSLVIDKEVFLKHLLIKPMNPGSQGSQINFILMVHVVG